MDLSRKITTRDEGYDLVQGFDITFAPAASTDRAFYVATRPTLVTAVVEVHSAAEATAATLTLQLVKDTSTAAPGAGTDLLSAAFNLKAAANTPQVGALVSEATRTLAAGDRLSLDFSTTATELAGVVVTVSLRQI